MLKVPFYAKTYTLYFEQGAKLQYTFLFFLLFKIITGIMLISQVFLRCCCRAMLLSLLYWLSCGIWIKRSEHKEIIVSGQHIAGFWNPAPYVRMFLCLVRGSELPSHIWLHWRETRPATVDLASCSQSTGRSVQCVTYRPKLIWNRIGW